jgi:hypothetical protein
MEHPQQSSLTFLSVPPERCWDSPLINPSPRSFQFITYYSSYHESYSMRDIDSAIPKQETNTTDCEHHDIFKSFYFKLHMSPYPKDVIKFEVHT